MKPFILYATLGLTSLCGAWVFPRDLPDGVYHIEIPDKDDTKAKPLVKRANPEADLTFKPSFYGEDQWKYKSAHGVPENFRYWYEDVLEEPKHIKYAEKPKHSKKLEHFMNIKDGKKRKRPKNIETNVKFGELRRVKETAPLTEPNWLINRKKHKDPKHLVYAPQKDAPSLPVLDPPGDHGEVPVHALDKRCIYSKPRYDQHEADYEIARANLINYCSRWGLPSRSSHVSAARSGEVIVYACNLKWKDNICSAREYVWIEKQFLDSTCGHNTPGWAKVDKKGRMYGRGWTGDDICVDTGVEEFPVQNIIWAGRPPEWGNKNKPWFHKTVDKYINNLPLANGFTTPDRGFRAEWDLLRLDGMPDDEKSIKEKYKQRPRPPGGPYKPKTKEEQAAEDKHAEEERSKAAKLDVLKKAKEKAEKEKLRQEQADIVRADAMRKAEEARLEQEQIDIKTKVEEKRKKEGEGMEKEERQEMKGKNNSEKEKKGKVTRRTRRGRAHI